MIAGIFQTGPGQPRGFVVCEQQAASPSLCLAAVVVAEVKGAGRLFLKYSISSKFCRGSNLPLSRPKESSITALF
jgi:hypothetical protein